MDSYTPCTFCTVWALQLQLDLQPVLVPRHIPFLRQRIRTMDIKTITPIPASGCTMIEKGTCAVESRSSSTGREYRVDRTNLGEALASNTDIY